MRRNFYRFLLVVFAAWISMCVPTCLVTLCRADFRFDAAPVILLTGMLLLPISVFGLWNDKTWGLVILLGGTGLVLSAGVAMGILHLIVLALAGIRLIQVKRERGSGKAKASA